MKKRRKKALTAATGAAVIGVAAAALVNGSKLESMFDPGKFEKFENRYKTEDYDYVAGNGEDMDLADQDKKNKSKSGGNDKQLLKLNKQKENDTLSSDIGLVDETTTKDENQNQPEDTAETNQETLTISNQEPDTLPSDENRNTTTEVQVPGKTNPSAGNNSNTNNTNRGNQNGGNRTNPSASVTPSATGVPAATKTPAPTDEPEMTATPVPTQAAEPTAVPTQGPLPTATAAPVPTSGPVMPTPTESVQPTETPSPTAEPTQAPAPTVAPTSAPTQVPTATPTVTPTSTPSPTPTPISWEDQQKKPDPTVKIGDDTLLSISASMSRTEFAFGDGFEAEYATVTAKLLTPDGKTVTKEVKYGGEDGYSVSFSTQVAGNQTAMFSFKGKYASVSYKVMNNSLDVNYMATYANDGRYYLGTFPGAPLKSILGDAYDSIVALVSMPNNYAKSGNIVDMREVHSRMIAYLGNKEMTDAFAAASDQNYGAITVLKEEGGYLKNMLKGMAYIRAGELMDSRCYTLYPVQNWDTVSRTVVDIAAPVPDGYKIRRVTENDGDMSNYRGKQVLEQYTGSDRNMTVPMGTTAIDLKSEASTVEVMKIPQSVTEINTETLGKYLPSLQNYAYEDENLTYLNYTVKDGLLYSKDGKTLLSVPAGRKTATIPATVKKLAKGCFRGLSKDAVITFEGDTPPTLSGDTECKCHIVTKTSENDSICKAYMFAFGKACADISFDTEDGKKNPYQYVEEGPVLVNRENPSRLEGVSSSVKGQYAPSDTITEIGGGAFASCNWITEIELGENVTEISEGGLILPGSVASVTLKGTEVKISERIFGSPESGRKVPSVRVYVPEEAYDSYLKEWTELLDPVYGEGTAGKLLKAEKKEYLYEDGAKYEVLRENGKETYILDKLYRSDVTSLEVKAGTTEILQDAFSGCSALEFILIPDTVEKTGENIFEDCTALEMVALGKPGLFDGIKTGIRDEAEVLTAGTDFLGFAWDDGILYGTTEEGYTLLNVPTDIARTINTKEKTTAFYQKALKGCRKFTTLNIEDEDLLKSIGDYCFEDCAAMMGFYVEDCKNLETIGKGAFRGCYALVEVTLPEKVDTIPEETFYDCSTLKKIKSSGIRTIGDRAFKNCTVMEDPGDLSAVESLGNEAFYNCRRMTGEVTLPETLTSMGESCFQGCLGLNSIRINGNLPGISRYCFYGCRSLAKIEFPDTRSMVSSLRVIGVRAFGQCTMLETMDLSKFGSLSAMGERAFEGCTNLTTVKMPTSLQEVSDRCFEDCTNLSILQLDGEDVTGLGESVFGDTLPSFLHVWVEEDMVEKYTAAYTPVLDPVYGEGTAENILGVINANAEIIKGMLFENTDEGKILKSAPKELAGEIVLPSTTIKIEDDAFAGCEKITEIGIAPDTSIILGDRCFKGCTGLTQVLIEGPVSYWGDETFMDCTGLKTFILGRRNDQMIDRIGKRAFMNCTGLDNDFALQFHYGVRSLGEECFAGCTNLTNVAVSTLFQQSLQVIEDGAFKDCVSLRAFLTSKYTSLTTIGAHAFDNCDTLKQPVVPKTVTSIGEGCFMNCDNLTYVSFYAALAEYPKDSFKNCPNLIRTGGTADAFTALRRIGEDAYSGCKSLTASTSWNLGKYVHLEEIGDRAFENCATLASSELSATLTKIGNNAFDGCTAMKLLYLHAETPPALGSINLANMAADFGIRVPDSADNDDQVYKAYLEALSTVLGEKDAWKILDSFTDGAKDRVPEKSSEDTDETTPELTPEITPEVTPEETGENTAETPQNETSAPALQITGDIVGIVQENADDTLEIEDPDTWENWEADMRTAENKDKQ